MASDFVVAAAMTVPPGLAALFYLLRRYEGYFEDARVFLSLMVGFFAGLVAAFLQNVLFRFDSPEFADATGAAFAFSYYVVGYALVDSAAMTVVLGSSRYRSRKDTPYYGAALGIGFGMMLALQQVALALERGQLLDRQVDANLVTVLALLVCLTVGAMLAAGAAGVWVGRGTANKRLWAGLAHGAAVQMPILLALWFSPAPGTGVALVPAVGALAYGLFITLYTQRKVLDVIVPPEIRDQVLKERRREQREQMR